MGGVRKRPIGENMTATEVLDEQTKLQLEKRMIDEMVAKAAKEFQEEMDFTILADFYKSSGWTEIDFDPYQRPEAIKAWLTSNCKGHRVSRGRRFLFQRQSDAINFVLRWTE